MYRSTVLCKCNLISCPTSITLNWSERNLWKKPSLADPSSPKSIMPLLDVAHTSPWYGDHSNTSALLNIFLPIQIRRQMRERQGEDNLDCHWCPGGVILSIFSDGANLLSSMSHSVSELGTLAGLIMFLTLCIWDPCWCFLLKGT